MKKVALLLIFGFVLANAQEAEFTFTTEKGMTDFIVIPVDGKTAPDIYNKIIEWIKVTYKNPNDVILSTITNEYIRFEGAADIAASKSKFQIEIFIKDGKYKFDLISLQVYVSPNQMGVPVGWSDYYINFLTNSTEETRENMYKSDGTYKSWCKKTPEVPLFFNGLNKSMLEYILGSIKKTEGW